MSFCAGSDASPASRGAVARRVSNSLALFLILVGSAGCAPTVMIADESDDGEGGEAASGGSDNNGGSGNNGTGGKAEPKGGTAGAGARAGEGGGAGAQQGGSGGDVEPIDADGDGSPADQDCDDTNPEIHPGAVEHCDGIDNDCDPSTDDQGDVGPGRGHATIQAAIAASMPGDTIEVCPGTYFETLVLNRDLTLVAFGGAHATIIDGTSIPRRSVVAVAAGVTATIQGFTLTNGTGTSELGPRAGLAGGGGVANLGTLVLRDCLVTRNSASSNLPNYGGGVLNLGSMVIDRCEIRENTVSGWGGGIASGEVNDFPTTKLVIQNSLIAENHAGDCGGLNDFSTELLEVYDSDFVGNTAEGIGGGLCDRYGLARIDGSKISGNSVPLQWSGGLYVADLEYQIRTTDITDNTAPSGAGIWSYNARGTFVEGSVLRNQATGTSPLGPGAWLGENSQFAATETDFGADADDNLPAPNDIFVDDDATSHAYETNATFVCTSSGCR